MSLEGKLRNLNSGSSSGEIEENISMWSKSLLPVLDLDLSCGPAHQCVHCSWLHSGWALDLLPPPHKLLSLLSLTLSCKRVAFYTSVQGPPTLSTEPSLYRFPTISDARCCPPLISSHVTYLSHTTQLSLWTSHSHSDYHLVPKQNLSSFGWRKSLWMRQSLSLSASSSSDTRTHPGNLSPEQSWMLFTGNCAIKSITWGWIFFH